MINRFMLNETSYHGKGAREKLVYEIKKRGFKKCLVVTDKNLYECGVTKKVTDLLDNAKIEYEVFCDLKPNPTVKNVQDGLEVCKKIKADVIIAVGGGSAIDTAKGIGITYKNPEYEDVVSLCGAVETKNESLPIIALPTTAGTAAEVTINYVITDEDTKTKMVCVDPHDIPQVAIIDSELMSSMPKMLAAATGMDALTHAIEGYITKAHWEMSDMFHLKAIKLIFKYLENAVNNKDEEAIEKMALAQYIAGMGFSNVGLGIVHSMAHQLGAVYDTPHGIANAILLPYVMKYNGEECFERFKEILEALEVDTTGMDKEKIIGKFVKMISDLSRSVGITSGVADVGGKESDLKYLAKKAMNDPCTPGNPRTPTIQDIIEIYKEAM